MGMTAVHSVLPESNLAPEALARKFHMAEGGVTSRGMINARTGRWDYLHKWPWPDIGLSEGEVTSLDIHQRATGWWNAGQRWPADMGLAGLDEGENTSSFIHRRATGWWDYEYHPWLETDMGLAGLGQSCDPYTQLEYCLDGGSPGWTPPTQYETIIVPPPTDPSWTSITQQLITQGFKLADILAMQPGTVITGNQLLRQAPGYPVGSGYPPPYPPPVIPRGLGVSATASGGIVILGLGLIAIMMLSQRRD